jgi:hypothetical protein
MASEVLGTPSVRFVEPAFSDIIDEQYNDALLASNGSEGRLLIDENEDVIGLAFGEGATWDAGALHLRKANRTLIERFEATDGEIYEENREIWAGAVNEYYNLDLIESQVPAIEDMNPDRVGMVEDLIAGFWGDLKDCTCLDCCCGSGVGSLVLQRRGITPLAYDNDPNLLALGLTRGRLDPKRTMWIDATMASRYTGNVPAGLGLMIGEINAFNAPMWEQIVWELVSLTDMALFSVGKEEEARLVQQWTSQRGRSVEVIENQRDPIYDRWICSVTRD